MQYELTGRDFKLILPPERIAIYGDSEWRHTMFKATSKAVRIETSLSHHQKEKTKSRIFTFLTEIVFFTDTGKS